MNSEFFKALDLLEKERNIPKSYMREKVEAALASACRKELGGTNIRVQMDEVKQDFRVFEQKTVVEEVTSPKTEISLSDAKAISRRYKLGDTVETELKTKEFGRISASTAKQVIIQGIREAERGQMIEQYQSKKREIITVKIERVDPLKKTVYVNTGDGISALPVSEQIPGETYLPDHTLKVLISEVKQNANGPVLTLSRSHPDMLRRLLELEVPEIRDGSVQIMNISREPGSRSKVAVQATTENVDPVGACIGEKGMRINNIVNELNGEKIDIIRYSDDPTEYIRAALAPAKIQDVSTAPGERVATIHVAPDQLSLAIGKEGQNARLAAKLTGHKIDIKTR